MSLLEANETVSIFDFNGVPVTKVSSFDLVDQFAFCVQELHFGDTITILCSDLDGYYWPIFWEFKRFVDLCSSNLR